MGTVIRMIFREGVSRQRTSGKGAARRSSLARERGLTLWREREDLVIAAAYRIAPPDGPRTKPGAACSPCIPLKSAPQT
jgi:hypothetical protein